MSNPLLPRKCPRCTNEVITAFVMGGSGAKIVLNAAPVVGGDWAIWAPGNLESMRWIAALRPAAVSPPSELRGEDRFAWDGFSAADSRPWYVQHEHGCTSAEILQSRPSSTPRGRRRPR